MISLMPWGRAEEAVIRLEAEPTLATLEAARSALDDLAKRSSIPGVKKRAAEFEARWTAGRLRAFDDAAQAGDHAATSGILKAFPLEASRADETLRLAAVALAAGEEPPSLAAVPAGGVKWELRSVYFAVSESEAAAAADWARSRELLSLWIQHAPAELEPHARLITQCLLHGETELAIGHFAALDASNQEALVARLTDRDDLPTHGLAWFFLQIGRSASACDVLDAILEENPSDGWALSHRVAIAEAAGETAAARVLYERIVAVEPGNAGCVRRLAELAHADGDAATAASRYREAWHLGDVGAGLSLGRLLIASSREEAGAVAEEIASKSESADDVFAAGEIFLGIEDSARAARAFRRTFLMDRLKADKIIAVGHAYAERHEEDRLPLLELLSDIGPVRGYSSDPYNLMRAEDLVRIGKPLEARPLLEELVESSLRWKVFATLARMVLAETPGAMIQMMQRIDSVIAEADRVGRSIGAEMRYHAAVLCDEAGRGDEAIKRLEDLISREFQYRDARERLERLRGGSVVESALQ